MKKLDLHIHTIPTVSDRPFDFSMESLKKYVNDLALDAIAITNHNVFDESQFGEIVSALEIPVFPGIEVDIEGGHLLVITDPTDIEDFSKKCAQVFRCNGSCAGAFISEAQFVSIFSDLSRYLMIPHYDKSPILSLERVPQISKYIKCGEVSSAKKFLTLQSIDNEKIPVLFSDWRAEIGADAPIGRQTYFDIDEVTLTSIKYALTDSAKVSLKPEDGNTIFPILDNGLQISTGLTVVLGKRSSGKTFTLSQISEQFPGGKYIKQFSLLSTDEDQDEKKFEELLKAKGDSVSESYLAPFKDVVNDVIPIDLNRDEHDIDAYLSALKKSAEEAQRQDVFSKAALYQETLFSIRSLTTLESLIDAVDVLITTLEYKELLEKHVGRKNLLSLAIDLRAQYIHEKEELLYREYINSLIVSVKKELQVRSAATPVPDIDFYSLLMNAYKVEVFNSLAKDVRKERTIETQNLYSYRIVATCCPYNKASELVHASRRKMAFADAFKLYDKPYEFLNALKEKPELPNTEYYKYFANITYKVLNQYGCPASGGERSEYNLLQELSDGGKKSILILDEPESSFDNIFLKDGVDSLLKDISKSIPVVVATHNNTIGVSIHPDYIIYTQKEVLPDGGVKYHLYSGYPSSSDLIDLEGNHISRKDVLLDCLEAGEIAYIDRRGSYEILNH